jgi:hypothetical protein
VIGTASDLEQSLLQRTVCRFLAGHLRLHAKGADSGVNAEMMFSVLSNPAGTSLYVHQLTQHDRS